jgi:hypothetical protein
MAAQGLARGQRVVRAAASAALPPARLRELLDDEDFRDLIEAEREQLALAPEERQRVMDGANRQAIERALADGRVSIVAQLLRLRQALPALAKSAAGRPTTALAFGGGAVGRRCRHRAARPLHGDLPDWAARSSTRSRSGVSGHAIGCWSGG